MYDFNYFQTRNGTLNTNCLFLFDAKSFLRGFVVQLCFYKYCTRSFYISFCLFFYDVSPCIRCVTNRPFQFIRFLPKHIFHPQWRSLMHVLLTPSPNYDKRISIVIQNVEKICAGFYLSTVLKSKNY